MVRFSCSQWRQAGLAMLLVITISGCAGPFGYPAAKKRATAFLDPDMTMQIASDAVVVGESTKEGVTALLGPASVVRFDNGFEVWIYRASAASETATPAEFVILFAPSGVVKKTRLRPAT